MTVLDELREALLGGLHPPDAETFGDYIDDTFRDFEAAHPGLVDAGPGPCACSCGAIYWRSDVLRVCPACAKAST